ncbi:hypothetical protein CCR97_08185 [Rhodoplanes elegans]|uniref:Putative HNH nuclease YajD n=1 Tax=Rhodoplanes elegans TaxID=29408 RepID=A0A327KXM3_9BRAD|nr:hypothetical protein [Rhodoplanes elegans]MBK5958189.1 hypothetical protein [Rhodoplanes elegans]RAI41972.1 hypothetical protein CH338_01325 [Rhodoplanes elegans]
MARLSARQRGYSTAWDKARAGFLRDHPWCAICLKAGRYTQATVVDHIKPHRGDQSLFWDRSNWQALDATCHSSAKQKAEKSGKPVRVTGVDGWPID